MKISFPFFPLLAGSLLIASCASNPGINHAGHGAVPPDHKPGFDYWQNGGGACCPYHAQMYQAQALRKLPGS